MPEISDEELAEYQRLKDDQGATDLYGGGTPVGGGTPGGGAPTEDEVWINSFQRRFSDPSEKFSVQEVQRYAQKLGGAHLAMGLAENSSIFRRWGISPRKVMDTLTGKERQQRPSRSGVGIPPRS